MLRRSFLASIFAAGAVAVATRFGLAERASDAWRREREQEQQARELVQWLNDRLEADRERHAAAHRRMLLVADAEGRISIEDYRRVVHGH